MMDALAAMPKYEAYKESGVDWLGSIPESWDLKPGLVAFSENKRNNKGMKEDTVLSLSYGKIIIKPEEKLVGLVPESFETYQLVEPSDIIIRCTDLQNDKVSLRTGLAKDKGIITSAYLNLKVKSGFNSRFLHYYLHALDTTKVIYKFGSGLRQNLSFLDFKRLPVFDIPEETQEEIANYLDAKTAQIDEAISIKETQIALLKERMQIFIQKIVTQGLNPDVPMKESGVDWIGKIPENWEVLPLTKYSTRVDYRGKTPEKVDEGRFLLTAKNIKYGHIDYEISKEYILEKQYEKVMSRGKPEIGDLLFTTEAPLGGTALVDDPSVAIAQRLILFRLADKLVSGYVNLYMQTPLFQNYLQRLGTGSTALGIKASKLFLLKLIAPPKEEQTKIYRLSEKVTNETNSAIEAHKRQIEKLKEYKSTLINSAVTGKIKVA
jgi:type I restriction enzyme S subunit